MNKEQLLTKLKELNLPLGEYYLSSSGCLMLYGMREVIGDIDLCVSEKLFEQFKAKYHLTDNDRNAYGFYKINAELEIVVSNRNNMEYDVIDDIPVEKLETILAFKKMRNWEKDQQDIINITNYLNGFHR